jgi:hypothetical protein
MKNAYFKHLDWAITISVKMLGVNIEIVVPFVDIDIGGENVEQLIVRSTRRFVDRDFF